MAHENPGLVDSSARARASVIHGLRRAPALLLVQGRGYTGKRIGQMCIASTLDGVLNRHRLERSRSEVDGGCNGQLGVANTVTFSEGIASSGEMQRSSIYGQETRTAFPYERKRASFDSRRRSVHVALENYGLNCPAPVSPSPMRSKSALGRALIPRTVRQLLFSSNDGQVDSLFDHEAEHFEFPTETEYRYLTHENALPSGVPTENILPSKRQSQIYNPGERITADIHVRSDLFDTCGEFLRLCAIKAVHNLHVFGRKSLL